NHFLLCKHLVRQTVDTPNGKRRCLIRCKFTCHTTPPFLILNNHDTNKTTSPEVQAAVYTDETYVVNNFSSSYNADLDKNLDEEAYNYVEANWKLFKQAFERICSKKNANNWRQVSAMMK
ncbi:10260_t:CDS:1, partial [Cetraspora pellucida]